MFTNSFREENPGNKSEGQKDTAAGREFLRRKYWELFALAESLNKILLENPDKNQKAQELWDKSDKIAVRIDEGENVPETEIKELMEGIKALISKD